jgi:hypothetical protein
MALFLIIIAAQNPCPWWGDTVHGPFTVTFAHVLSILFIAYIGITIGDRIIDQWSNEKSLFYFDITVQLGLVFGGYHSNISINKYF